MALPFGVQDVPASSPHDPRSLRILAKTIYRELRQSGVREEDMIAIAGELVSLVATEMRERRAGRPR
jgi:hypothetical protein